jgi:PAS domain S-box-containing protein
MILEQLGLLITLCYVLILIFFTLRYRNILVLFILILTVIGLGSRSEARAPWLVLLSQINLGLLTYCLYDYMKSKQTLKTLTAVQHSQAILQAAEYAIIGVTLDGTINNWSASAQQLYGFTAAQMIGKNIDELTPEKYRGEYAKVISKVTKGSKVDGYRTRRLKANGQEITVEVTITPVFNADGDKVIAAASISREVQDDRAN